MNTKPLYEKGLLYDNLTETQAQFFLKYIWNGVGSDELKIDPPDSILKGCSKYHDFFFFRGGDDQLRVLADRDFLNRCLERIKKSPTWKSPLYKTLAFIYYLALVAGSKYAWEYYDKPAETWQEFIQHVISYYDRKKKDYPWKDKVLDPFTV